MGIGCLPMGLFRCSDPYLGTHFLHARERRRGSRRARVANEIGVLAGSSADVLPCYSDSPIPDSQHDGDQITIPIWECREEECA